MEMSNNEHAERTYKRWIQFLWSAVYSYTPCPECGHCAQNPSDTQHLRGCPFGIIVKGKFEDG